MENLPQKRVDLFLELRKPELKAIDKRRKMMDIPEVNQKLNSIEKYIFHASTRTLISEMSDDDLVKNTKTIFRFIAKDVGYRIPTDASEWKFTCTRLFKYLKMYHSNLALSEISLAFELSVNGDLDEYLPKGKDDTPDRSHYQEFNIDFFSKILKAYKEKQGVVITKAVESIPVIEYKSSPEESNYYHNQTVNTCKMIYLKYKYCDILELDGLKIMFIWDWLSANKLINSPVITDDIREKALKDYLRKSEAGHINRYTAAIVKKEGVNSKNLDFASLEIAKIKEIKKAFNRMVKYGADIEKYLNYKS